MQFLPSKVPVILDFDNKMHGALSVVSYVAEYSDILGYSEEEKNKIINQIYECQSFELVLKLFKRYFGEYVNIRYRGKII